jgi:hypothetical protein
MAARQQAAQGDVVKPVEYAATTVTRFPVLRLAARIMARFRHVVRNSSSVFGKTGLPGEHSSTEGGVLVEVIEVGCDAERLFIPGARYSCSRGAKGVDAGSPR